MDNKNNSNGNQPEETTAMAVTTNIVGSILTPADLKALDALIQTLGSKSANLTESEKTNAIAIVDDWNKSVTARIQANADRARTVLSFLDGNSLYGAQLEETIELFHDAIGDTPEYLAYMDALDKYADVQRDEPVPTPVESSMTVAQVEQISSENYRARLEHNRQLKVVEINVHKAVKAYVTALNKLPEIRAMKGNLKSYKNKASRLATECADKAACARLNITISDPDVRGALHDMMEFAKKI